MAKDVEIRHKEDTAANITANARTRMLVFDTTNTAMRYIQNDGATQNVLWTLDSNYDSAHTARRVSFASAGWIGLDTAGAKGRIVFTDAATDTVAVMTANLGVGITTPDSTAHFWKATAGAVASDANAIMTLENSTHAYLHILVPDGSLGGLFVGSPANNKAGWLQYVTHPTVASGYWQIVSGAVSVMRWLSTEVVINDAGSATIDTRMESDNSEKMFFLDASADVIQIHGEDGCTIPALNADTVAVFAKNDGAGQACYISVIGDDTGACGIQFGDNNTEFLGRISYDHGSHRITFYNQGTSYGYLDVNGFLPTTQATIHAVSQNGAPTSTTQGALWLDADAGANGTLMCYGNGAWRTVAAL